MKTTHFLAIAAMSMLAMPIAEAESSRATPAWKSMKAQYLVHSGHATYAEAPSRTHSAVTLAFEGKPAKEIFDQMGPDSTVKCSSEDGDRERRNKGALCVYTAKLDSPSGLHYRCWIGVDLRTGEGNQGVSC